MKKHQIFLLNRKLIILKIDPEISRLKAVRLLFVLGGKSCCFFVYLCLIVLSRVHLESRSKK